MIITKRRNILPALFLMLAIPATHALAAKKKGTDATQTTKTAPAKPVDLNTASESELIAVPGIGSATAKKIIAGRKYSSVDDLLKAGVAKTTLDKIRPNVTVSGNVATPAAKPSPTAAAPAPAPTPTPAAAAKPAKTVAASTPQPAPPAGSGQVWVNLETKVYHKEGDRWYGKTKKGKYMSEADAIKANYRAAK